MALRDMRQRIQGILRRGGKRNLIAGALHGAYLASATGLMREARGRGAIFTLHHVRPASRPVFEANAHLEITPDFLEAAIVQLRSEGYDFLRLDELPDRLRSNDTCPFAVFTLDDGYYDNAEHALPVFERHGVPFTIFITRGFAERTHSLWWETLEELLPRLEEIEFDFGNGPETVPLKTPAHVQDCFDRFARYVFTEEETTAVASIDALARRHGTDPLALTGRLVMGTADLKTLGAHPLAAFGAHTISHRAIARLSDQEAREELRQSADWLEQQIGMRPTTFAFPYGMPSAVSARDIGLARDLCFAVAVTTQPGTLSQHSLNAMTGLPRISLNGYFQRPKYVSALASGIPFALSGRRRAMGTS